MTRVLLTGANGHLGANLVRSLLKHGYQVIAFVRPGADLRGLAGLDVQIAYGDVLDGQSLVSAAAGVDVIIHSAAVFRYWVNDGTDIVGTSITGARFVFAAAQAQGIKRIIYTSSTYAIGSTPDINTVLTAEDWNQRPHSPYAIAKTMGEREAWRLSESSGIPLVVVCPAGIWGPYDYRITPAMGWIRGLVNGTIPVIKAGGSFVDVRDAAEVHALAIEHGQPGRRYIVAGEDLRMADMATIVRRLTGTRHIHLNLGLRPMLFFSGLMEIGAKVSGRPPLATRSFIRDQLNQYYNADPRDTNETFGIKPRGGEAMIDGAIAWLIHIGAIRLRKRRRLAVHFPPDIAWGPAPAGN